MPDGWRSCQVTSIIDFVTSVVAFSADIQQEHELYTVEDGLSLWLATLRNLPAPHPPLQALFPQVSLWLVVQK